MHACACARKHTQPHTNARAHSPSHTRTQRDVAQVDGRRAEAAHALRHVRKVPEELEVLGPRLVVFVAKARDLCGIVKWHELID